MAVASRVGVEEQFYDYARRLARYRQGRRAVLVRLSRLTKPFRQPSYQHAAREPFARLLRRYEGQLFTLPNDDFVCVLKGVSASELDRAVLAVQALVREDPNMRAAEADGRELAFLARFYDIAQDYDAFLALARAVAEGRDPEELEEGASSAPAAPGGDAGPPAAEAEAPLPEPDWLEAETAAGLLRHLGRIDPRAFLREGTVRLAAAGRAAVMDRIGFDLAALVNRLAPGRGLASGSPAAALLAQALTERLLEVEPAALGWGGRGRPLLLDFPLEPFAAARGRAWLSRLHRAGAEAGLVVVVAAGEALARPGEFAKAAALAKPLGIRAALGGLPLALAPAVGDQKRWPVALLLFSATASGREVRAEAPALVAGIAPERLVWCADDGEETGAPQPFRLFAPF
ncbi:MAG: hypothetical protein KatS3mg119_2474 [Rhodothalassiaceae bacterium]|nr:MAG: hypothetical protein KatS3mg119_2474 [Rhodothalassiaceae bacterium]